MARRPRCSTGTPRRTRFPEGQPLHPACSRRRVSTRVLYRSEKRTVVFLGRTAAPCAWGMCAANTARSAGPPPRWEAEQHPVRPLKVPVLPGHLLRRDVRPVRHRGRPGEDSGTCDNVRRTRRMPGWLDQPERPKTGGFRQRHRRGRSRITTTVFARCLLVCPGTGRHDLASADTETGLAAHNPALRGTESIDLISEQRTLNPRVRRRRSRNRRRHGLACDGRTTPATPSRRRLSFAVGSLLCALTGTVLAQRRTEPTRRLAGWLRLCR
jgi:hypothetical protein